jgi:ankyrin repeat protein
VYVYMCASVRVSTRLSPCTHAVSRNCVQSGQTALMIAARAGAAGALRALLKCGADKDARMNVRARPGARQGCLSRNGVVSQDGRTTLMIAAKNDSIAVMRLLIADGADSNAKDKARARGRCTDFAVQPALLPPRCDCVAADLPCAVVAKTAGSVRSFPLRLPRSAAR